MMVWAEMKAEFSATGGRQRPVLPACPSLLAPIRLLAASAVLHPGLCLRVSNYADLGLWDRVSRGGPAGCKSGLIC